MTTVILEVDLAESLHVDWFQGDFGTTDQRVLEDKIVEARKKHQCHNCSKDVAIGEVHRLMKERADGELHTYRWCQRCCVVGLLHMQGHIV